MRPVGVEGVVGDSQPGVSGFAHEGRGVVGGVEQLGLEAVQRLDRQGHSGGLRVSGRRQQPLAPPCEFRRRGSAAMKSCSAESALIAVASRPSSRSRAPSLRERAGSFGQGLWRCEADGSDLECLAQYSNNSRGLGSRADGEIRGSTANGALLLRRRARAAARRRRASLPRIRALPARLPGRCLDLRADRPPCRAAAHRARAQRLSRPRRLEAGGEHRREVRAGAGRGRPRRRGVDRAAEPTAAPLEEGGDPRRGAELFWKQPVAARLPRAPPSRKAGREESRRCPCCDPSSPMRRSATWPPAWPKPADPAAPKFPKIPSTAVELHR